MDSVQRRIVKEILKELQDRKEVVGISMLGSTATKRERPDSDVDIQIIYNDKRTWSYFKQEKYGVPIDFEEINRADFQKLIKEYPYFCYEMLKHSVVLIDKENILQQAIQTLDAYYKANPKIAIFWMEKYKALKEAKSKSEKAQPLVEVYDEAEERFGDPNKPKRTILTKAFFEEYE